MSKHVKPITFKQAMQNAPPNELRAIVVAALNRAIRKHLRVFHKLPLVVTIPNHISPEMAAGIAKDYERSGWKVTIEDLTSKAVAEAWRFTFDKGA